MSSTWELKEHSQGELKVICEGEAWKKAQDKAFNKLAKNVEIKGFRKGKVPANMARKAISTQSILIEAVESIANDLLFEGVEEHQLYMITRPELDIDDISEDQAVLKFTVTVYPTVELGEYKGLDIAKADVEVTEEEIENELKKLQERYAELELKEEGEVENGDTAVIDFEGFKDGIPFEGGKGENYPLEIGSGSFIPGFEEQLIGMKSEETKNINVTFPEEYGAEELAGQDVVFAVTVHDIKTKVLPEANDDLIVEAEMENVKTVEEFKEFTKKDMLEYKEKQAEQNFETDILNKLVENTPIDVPEVMEEDELNSSMNDFAQRLASQGFPLDQYYELTGLDEEQLRAQMLPDAQKKVRVRLILDKIAETEGIEITDEDAETEYANLAEQYGLEVEQVKQSIDKDTLVYDLRLQKAVAFVKENVK